MKDLDKALKRYKTKEWHSFLSPHYFEKEYQKKKNKLENKLRIGHFHLKNGGSDGVALYIHWGNSGTTYVYIFYICNKHSEIFNPENKTSNTLKEVLGILKEEYYWYLKQNPWYVAHIEPTLLYLI